MIDHGTQGHVFPIAEEDMLAMIQGRLKAKAQDGSLAGFQARIVKETQERAKRPQPLSLPPTTQERTWTHDPTLRVAQDIHDDAGNVIAHHGQQINPLDHVTPRRGLLFIDGDDGAQVSYAKARANVYIIVLTKGAPLDVGETIGERVYFDQGGQLTTAYGITHIPARIDPVGKTLEIREFTVNGGERS